MIPKRTGGRSRTAINSGADVAETGYTCFAATRDVIDVRLIVRRVRPTSGSQLALFTNCDYHAFVTDRDGGRPSAKPITAASRRRAIDR